MLKRLWCRLFHWLYWQYYGPAIITFGPHVPEQFMGWEAFKCDICGIKWVKRIT